MIECGRPDVITQFETLSRKDAPGITPEDEVLYQKFLDIVGKTAMEHDLPVEKFAFQKFAMFGLPTGDFPGRDHVAHFQGIVEFTDKAYTRDKDPRPLRLFMEEYGALVGYKAPEGPIGTKAHMGDKKHGLYVFAGSKRPVLQKISQKRLHPLVKSAHRELENADDDAVVRFVSKERDDGSKGIAYEIVDRPEGKRGKVGYAISGLYTEKDLRNMLTEIKGTEKVREAAGALEGVYTYVPPYSESRRRDVAAAKPASKFYKVNLADENWNQQWDKLYSKGVFTEIRNAYGRSIAGGIDQVSKMRDEGLRRLRGSRLAFKSGQSAPDEYSSSDDDSSDEEQDVPMPKVTWMRVVGVLRDSNYDDNWPGDVHGDAAMNYEFMLRKLQQWMNAHNFPFELPTAAKPFKSKFKCVRYTMNEPSKGRTFTIGETEGSEFEDMNVWEVIGASYTPDTDLVDGNMKFAAGQPIQMLHMTRAAGKSGGAWSQFRRPIGTNSDGTVVYVLEDKRGDVTGLMVESPAKATGNQRVWHQAIQKFY